MNPINLFGLGNQSKSSNLTSGHRLNLYYDLQVDGDKTTVAAIGTPGLDLFTDISSAKTYGMHWMESNNKLYVVQKSSLYEVSPDGNYELIFSVTGDFSMRVSMANNGTELALFTGKLGFIFNTQTRVIHNITDKIAYDGQVGDIVTFLDGRFIINRPNTAQFYISGLYDGLTWDALDFATAEGNPDNIISLAADKGNLVLIGSSSIELWANNGDPLFPFQRVNSAPSEAGLAARWSLTKCNGKLTGLFKSLSGMLAVCVLDGYLLVPISNSDIEYIFNNYQTPSDAVGFGYALNGLHFYQITFQAEGVTWLYDFQSKVWSQLKSTGHTRHLADVGVLFGSKFIVSDYQTGTLYTLNANARTDNGEYIERELTSAHVFATSRNKMTIRRLRVDIEGGIGLLSGQGDDPMIMLKISRDNGHTWGCELWTTLGKMGEYMHRAEWRRLGIARDWLFKIRITDPVKVVIIAAIVEGQELNK